MVTIGIFIASAALQGEAARTVLNRSQDLLDRSSSVIGDFVQTTPGMVGKAHGTFEMKKFVSQDMDGDRQGIKDDRVYTKLAVYGRLNAELFDGVYRTSIDKDKKSYTVRDVRVFDYPYVPGFEGFARIIAPVSEGVIHPMDKKNVLHSMTLMEKFDRETRRNMRSTVQMEPRNIKTDRFDDKAAVSYTVGGSKIYLDPRSALPIASEFVGENRRNVTMRFVNVQRNSNVNDDVFELKSQRYSENFVEHAVVERGMLRVGQRMPISNIDSMGLLEKEMKGKQSTVVLFFDDKNAPCGEMLKKMFEISKHCPRDVRVVGVARTANWRNMFSGHLNFTVIEDAPLAKDSVSALFGVTRYPTLYVLNGNGEATYVQIGSNDSELNPILRGLGFSVPRR